MARVKKDNSIRITEEIKVGCGMSGLLEMLTRPWTLHILWLLSHNARCGLAFCGEAPKASPRGC